VRLARSWTTKSENTWESERSRSSTWLETPRRFSLPIIASKSHPSADYFLSDLNDPFVVDDISRRCSTRVIKDRAKGRRVSGLSECLRILTVASNASPYPATPEIQPRVFSFRVCEFEASGAGCVIDRRRQYIKRASIQPEPDYYNTGSPRGDKNILFPGILSTTVLHALRITTDRVLNRIIRLYNISPASTRAHAHARFSRICIFTVRAYAIYIYIYIYIYMYVRHLAKGRAPLFFPMHDHIVCGLSDISGRIYRTVAIRAVSEVYIV